MGAYDSLKSLVRQYIKTNGQNEITGQILQNVLIAMIDDLGITIDQQPTKNSTDAVASGGAFDMIQDATNINATLSADGKIYNDYNAGDIFYIEQDDVRKYRVAYAAGTADAEHPVTINGTLFYFSDNASDAIWLSLRIKTVSTEQQSLSAQQKAQARTNIAAVSYDQQTLSADQQVQAQNNIVGKAYNAEQFSGLGKKILAKNVDEVGGVNKNYMTQAFFKNGNDLITNTVFVIQYDYELKENVEIGAGCTLEFDGGSISGNYTITGNQTIIKAGLYKIFGTDVSFTGSFNINNVHISWFINSDNTHNASIDKAMSLGCPVDFDGKTLTITRHITQLVPLSNGALSVSNSLAEPIDYVIDGSSWGSRLNNITINGNNKANIGIYANRGQQFNYMNYIYIRDCVTHGIKILEAWMGEWHKLIVWACGIGMEVSNANGTRVEKAEFLHCNKGLVINSGGAFVADGLDTSFSVDRDIDIIYESTSIQINNWYTEEFAGGASKAIIHMTNIGSLGINNAICLCKNGKFLQLDGIYENSSISNIVLDNVSVLNYTAQNNQFIYNPDNVYIENLIFNGVTRNPEILSLDWTSDEIIYANIQGVLYNKGKALVPVKMEDGSYDSTAKYLTCVDGTSRRFNVYENVSENDYIMALDRAFSIGHFAKITINADNINTYTIICKNNTILYNNVPIEDFTVLTNTGSSIYLVALKNFDFVAVESVCIGSSI